MNDVLQATANTIRGLAMDAVQKANSGHPGMPMGMADVATVLWLRHLRHSNKDPGWAGRDRFVLSAGHGSMLLYACLHLAGYPISLEDIRNFRQLHSPTPGHPEFGETIGVETTTGPLGQGFGNGVGMALGAKMEAARFQNQHLENRVFGIVSDGDLMEGISSEAASLAGHLALSNLVYLYDDNRITIDGGTDLTFSEDVAKRFDALGWRVLKADGHDLPDIDKALTDATSQASENGRPTLIICRTHIGFGSPNKQGSSSSHGAPLGDDEVSATKKALGISAEPFHVPDEVRETFAKRQDENEAIRQQWLADVASVEQANPTLAADHQIFRQRQAPTDLLQQLIAAAGTDDAATRAMSGKVVQKAAELVPSLVGGSADLDGSTKTCIKDSSAISATARTGRNLHFGVREHAMGAIINGLALQGGFLPMGSTFLVFSDYMRPSIRLAALMKLRCGFVFTHDSLMVGEDGPTHQPIEHVAALRLIPNLQVWRPADGPEVAAAWHALLTRDDGPVTLSLTRQGVPALQRPENFTTDLLTRGGYLLFEPSGAAQGTVIATGAEVASTLQAAKALNLRMVSMPCVEQFLAQPDDYREQVLASKLHGPDKIFAVEMGRPEAWCVFTGSLDRVIGLQSFGASAPASALAKHFGFTAAQIQATLKKML